MVTATVNTVKKSLGTEVDNAVLVFESATLQLRSPKVVSIVGPNGVGKTTFLRLLAGIISPDLGTIYIDGVIPSKSRVGYVPQSNPVFPWRKVIDDISIPLEILGMSKIERHQYVEELTERFSFDLPLNRRTFSLSGGQRQLVNLCRAVVGPKPCKLLLLDEPFASLDIVSQHEFISYLDQLFLDFDLIVVITTHQLDLAVVVSDVIVPFPKSPVVVSEADQIPIDIARPRSLDLRSESKFQNTLNEIEQLLSR